MTRRSVVATTLTVVVALWGAVGCSPPTPAEQALRAAEEKLDEIRSGRLSLALRASGLPHQGDRGVGFELEGPFSVGTRKGSLPAADLTYTAVIGATRRTTRFVSTGSRAFVEVGGERQELDDAQLEGLRVREEGEGGGGLDGLSLSTWIDKPSLSAGPASDGTATDRLAGAADPVPVLNDVMALAQQFGTEERSFRRLEGDGAERVRRAARESKAEVLVGRHDRLLRQLDVTIDLVVEDPQVREALGDLAGARLHLVLAVGAVNKPVTVSAPA